MHIGVSMLSWADGETKLKEGCSVGKMVPFKIKWSKTNMRNISTYYYTYFFTLSNLKLWTDTKIRYCFK